MTRIESIGGITSYWRCGSWDPEDDRWRLLQAITGFWRGASAAQPIMVVHGADRGTLDVLLQLARNLSGSRLLVIATYREVEVGRAHPLSAALLELRRSVHFTRLPLRGLTVTEVHRLYCCVMGPQPMRIWVDRITAEHAMHGWDIRSRLDTKATFLPASLPALCDMAARAVRRAFRPDPLRIRPFRLHMWSHMFSSSLLMAVATKLFRKQKRMSLSRPTHRPTLLVIYGRHPLHEAVQSGRRHLSPGQRGRPESEGVGPSLSSNRSAIAQRFAHPKL